MTKKPNTIEDDIDRIRLQIYEETKDMTIEQRVARRNRIGEAIAKQYGIRIVPNAKCRDCEMLILKEEGNEYGKK